MSFPSPDAIKKVMDPVQLQTACLSLIALNERDREAKRQYRLTASQLQQERDALDLQLKALRGPMDELKRQNSALLSEIESLKSETASRTTNEGSWTAPAEVLTLRNLVEMKDNEISQLSAERQEILKDIETLRNSANDRIEKLTKSLADEAELHRLEVEDLMHQLQGQSTENENLTGLRKKLAETSKAKLAKLRARKIALQQKVESLQTENTAQQTRIEELEVRVRAAGSENALLIPKLSELQRQSVPKEIVSPELSETVQRLNMELFELRSKQREETDLQAVLAERDSFLQKQRSQIQALLKQDNDKRATLSELQAQIHQLNENIIHLSSGNAIMASDEYTRLEREKAALEAQLRKAQGNEELAQKNQRLTEMLDRSNRLYAQLREKYDDLERFSNGRPILSLGETVDFELALPSFKKGAREKTELAQSAYLRRLLLQFFSEGQGNRATLIPVILKLVGCEEAQVCAALRQWERGNQLFSGLFGW
jgi:chromosome segregation ATPase